MVAEDQQELAKESYSEHRPCRGRQTWRHLETIVGHQKRVARRPGSDGWQASLEEWAHTRTAEWTVSGTNIRLSGPRPGFGWVRCASRTCFTIPQYSAITRHEVVSGPGVVPVGL